MDVLNAVVDTLKLPIKVSRETLEYWAEQLALATKIKGGAMDSESRHLELARNRQLIIESVADDIRSKL